MKNRVHAITILALILSLTGCAAQQSQHREEVIDRSTDQAAARPEWVRVVPKTEGRIQLVTTSTEGLSAEAGIRLAKAYAFAQLSEQARTEVKTKSKLSGTGQAKSLDATIEWSSAAIFRSLRQDDSYWEKRSTQEGDRYSVWVLWSIPEKAFYEAQQEALATGK